MVPVGCWVIVVPNVGPSSDTVWWLLCHFGVAIGLSWADSTLDFWVNVGTPKFGIAFGMITLGGGGAFRDWIDWGFELGLLWGFVSWVLHGGSSGDTLVSCFWTRG